MGLDFLLCNWRYVLLIAFMLQEDRWLVFRSPVPAAPDLPLRVRSVGGGTSAGGWRENTGKKWFLQIFWGIQEIAWQSGFADPNYFSRSIRQATGMSPVEFRRR